MPELKQFEKLKKHFCENKLISEENQLIVTHEDDVRAYVREASRGQARWVEPALGSTAGLPDCWVPWLGRCVHLELKAGELRRGYLHYEVRPEQRRELKAMVEDRIACGFLIGIKGGQTMVFARVDEGSLAGKVKIDQVQMGVKWLASQSDGIDGFLNGVIFIISDFGK